MKSIDDKASQAMRFAGYARESGLWPVTGGAMDQSPAFMEAEQQIRQDRAYWNAKLGLAD